MARSKVILVLVAGSLLAGVGAVAWLQWPVATAHRFCEAFKNRDEAATERMLKTGEIFWVDDAAEVVVVLTRPGAFGIDMQASANFAGWPGDQIRIELSPQSLTDMLFGRQEFSLSSRRLPPVRFIAERGSVVYLE